MVLKEITNAIESQMLARLQEIRARYAHAGDKGTSAENILRSFLREYLPRRLEIGQGEIIDSKGNRSKQTDVVIVNEDHPFTFHPDLPGLFFVEGVSGAGEVKAILDGDKLTKTMENSVILKSLEPNRGNLITSAPPADFQRYCRCLPYFAFCFESKLQLEKIRDRLISFDKERGISDFKMIDAVFVLGAGWVINFGNGDGDLRYVTPEGESIKGWIHNNSEHVLYDFLGWLSIVMPKTIMFKSVVSRYVFE